MKKHIIAIALATLSSGVLAQEAQKPFRPLGYPGYTWGSITTPSSVVGGVEEHNVVLQGKIEQGVDWFKFGKNVTVNTFVDLGYSVDNKNVPWNNKVAPGIGVKLKHETSFAHLEYGVRYGYERRWEDPVNRSGNGVQVFINWYTDWNLRK